MEITVELKSQYQTQKSHQHRKREIVSEKKINTEEMGAKITDIINKG